MLLVLPVGSNLEIGRQQYRGPVAARVLVLQAGAVLREVIVGAIHPESNVLILKFAMSIEACAVAV